jgi:hypothetical protein
MCTDDDVGKHGLLDNLLDIDEDDLDEDSSHGQVFFPDILRTSVISSLEAWMTVFVLCVCPPCKQREGPSLDEIIEEEHRYFLRSDMNGDSKLSKTEFMKHFIDSMGPS